MHTFNIKMKARTLILGMVIIAMLLAGAYAYNEYNRKAANLSKVEPTLIVAAKTLVSDYLTDEGVANKKYLGKIIEVKGVVISRDEQNIVLGDGAATNNVSCTLDDKGQKSILPNPGTALIVRGVCTGFLIDVELNRCVIINE